MTEIKKWNKADIDVGTFVELLKSVDEQDVTGYLYEYFGNGSTVSSFARDFVDRRKGKGWTTAGARTSGGDEGEFVSAGKSKKKKKKGQKIAVDFGVNSSGGANRGEIDSWQNAGKK
jgi:hypothetical protein